MASEASCASTGRRDSYGVEMLRRPLAVLLVAVLVLAGCTGGEDDGTTAFQAGTVTVTDAGDDARAVRSWGWEDASASSVLLTTAVTQSVAVDGGPRTEAPLPTAVTLLEITPTTGDARTELVVTVTDVGASAEGLDVEDVEFTDALADQAEAMRRLVGASAALGVTATGAVTDLSPATAPDVELPVATLLERTITELARLLVEFPGEPIGAGARWETTSTRISQGIAWNVTTSWRLDSVDGELHTVSFTLTESALRQGVPAAEGRDIEGMIEGEGFVVVDLAAAAIVSGELATSLEASIFDGDEIVATTSNRIGTISSS
jgi:hypothetical protein